MNVRAPQISGLPVVWKRRPFDVFCGVKRVDLPAAPRMPTIAEIIANLPGEELPRGFAEFGEVRVNDEKVPRGLWHLVRPRWRPNNGTIVSLTTPLRGGGSSSSSGGKNPIATVAGIAVLLVAAAFSGGLAAGLLGPAFAAGSIGAAVGGAAIAIGGALAIAALVPPPTLASPAVSASVGATSPTGATNPSAASLTGNILAPGNPVPRVVGTMQLFPPLLCNPLIELIGDVEVGEAVYGLAGPHVLANVLVGDTLTDSMTGVQTQLVEGKPGDAIQTLVQRQSFTLQPSAELLGHVLDTTTQYNLADQGDPAADVPQPQVFTSRKAPDEVWINLQWSSGLYDTNDTTVTVNQAFRVQIRQRGTSIFFNLPEVHFSQNTPGAFQMVIRLKWATIPVNQNPPPTNQAPVYVFKTVPGQDGSTASPATGGWTADASFSAGSGNDLYSAATVSTSKVKNVELYDDKVIFYLDAATFPPDYYDIQVTRSSCYKNASFTPATYSYSGTVLDFFQYYTSGGIYRIPEDPTPMQDTVVVTRLSSVWNQNPIQSVDFATISIKVQSRALDQLSVLASGYTHDWDGSGWNTYGATSNPVPHFYDVLTGNLGNSPLDPALVNSDELVDWRTDCIANSYTCNAVIEGKTYADALTMIASAGYANVRHNELWGVYEDKDRSAEAPVQIFTPRNMANFNWTRAFAQLPSGIRADYNDAADSYNADEVIVYVDPNNEDADNLSQITYDGLVNEADVIKRATFDLNQARDRFTFYQGDTDLECIVCQRGDLVAVQHDILIKQAGFSRISAVNKSDGNITGIELDGTIPVNTTSGIFEISHLFAAAHIFALGQTTGVAIRLKDGDGLLVKEIADGNGNLSSIRFATPFADPGDSLDADCLVAAGPLGQEMKRLIVYGIAPNIDLGATITFVDEAPQLWP